MKKITILAFVLLAVAALLYAVDALIVEPNGDVRTTAHLLVGGNVEADGRVEDKSGELVPVGTIAPYAFSNAPAGGGWLICDGSAISNTDPRYVDLVAQLRAEAGGNSAHPYYHSDPDKATLPDLRGRFARGLDTTDSAQDPRDPDRATRAVGSFQDDAFQGHWMGIVYHYTPSGRSGSPDALLYWGNSGASPDIVALGRNFYNDGVNGDPRVSSETRPDNVAVNYIIKY